mmetsp:Transcript_19614/g.36690  ORF Transcript_19614/g.36690 Transcript_19614/m.36690 type:complete len:204 (+) Transcript_19614:181-792(+)|eukprot:CAMPEP_0201602564 /NCGR_PEP_ID=MMETSP0492-20130828/3254_1 /ASSEMBLY_ACC=CAM_ASM_000837 /TAXON_ID=420259 /ORGANISM="Thalassiosira gravida, Strain GMp14c1" /LENGTH=203 /DNA_ID=CAMNT_0048066111 /DNA_START=202 /DNA_END=813 /DNA_ORIENTATION=-
MVAPRNNSPIRKATMFLTLLAVASILGSASAFAPPSSATTNHARRTPPSTSLSMAPRFDKSTNKWYTDVPEERAGSSYGPIGTLYRAGPKPFFSRVIDPDTYDQAVLKYMAQDGTCDRKEAQGNMDAFLENPQDWAYQKVQEQNGKYKKDYANANMGKKQVFLSTVWGLGVIYFIGNLAYNGIQGGGLSDSFHRTMELLGVDA